MNAEPNHGIWPRGPQALEVVLEEWWEDREAGRFRRQPPEARRWDDATQAEFERRRRLRAPSGDGIEAPHHHPSRSRQPVLDAGVTACSIAPRRNGRLGSERFVARGRDGPSPFTQHDAQLFQGVLEEQVRQVIVAAHKPARAVQQITKPVQVLNLLTGPNMS